MAFTSLLVMTSNLPVSLKATVISSPVACAVSFATSAPGGSSRNASLGSAASKRSQCMRRTLPRERPARRGAHPPQRLLRFLRERVLFERAQRQVDALRQRARRVLAAPQDPLHLDGPL